MALFLAASIVALSGCVLAVPSADSSGERAAAARVFEDPNLQALAIAAGSGDAETVRRLMRDEGVDPDGVFWGRDGGTPMLAWPIYRGNPEGLRAMLENGADPNAKTRYPSNDGIVRYHSNAMVWAARQKDPAYLQILLDHGGDPDTRNPNREALLFESYIHGNQWQNVQLLVERGADVNVQASPGSTILTSYAGRGGFRMAHWLLEHGADPSLQFSFGKPIQRSDSHAIKAIFWHPGNSSDPDWQVRCQRWLLANGFERPSMPEYFRKMRETFGFPHTEDQIPLPASRDDGGEM
ncbi:ankyrin repeat domain-containing protein [Luteimonas terrae]|uniref:Ankyrin repeat domain-containing protein n=1 Tax=Luteimonas terrae TaxID=1530191 RepID=A0ABU1Y1R9_9GAMM|nr:ankyrin repeat domain-containing protein [Luteimonas terrae]MDR7194773.1 hypothetical protein [Luteimonas terrae]